MKKSTESNLEKKRKSLLINGLILACCFSLCSFEWANFKTLESTNFAYQQDFIEEELIIPTYHKKKAKRAKKVEPPQQVKLISEIVDNSDVEVEAEMEELELDEETEIDEIGFEQEDTGEEEIFIIVEENPEFPGGNLAMKKFLKNNLEYPRLAVEAGIEGTVFLTFVIDKDGSIENVEVLRGIGGGCDKEAIQVVGKMPKWKPGKQRGKPVKVQFNMPITFTTH